jgi:hypothetical protein
MTDSLVAADAPSSGTSLITVRIDYEVHWRDFKYAQTLLEDTAGCSARDRIPSGMCLSRFRGRLRGVRLNEEHRHSAASLGPTDESRGQGP